MLALSAPHRGFSLLETAGVLGVVGIILGGIWVAAESSRESELVTQTLLQTGTITQNIRNLYKGSRISNISSFTITNLVRAGVFPPESLVGGTPQTPWGTPIAIQAVDDRSFTLTYTGLPDKGCMAVFGRYVGQARDPGLLALANNKGQDLSTGLTGGNAALCQTLTFTFRIR